MVIVRIILIVVAAGAFSACSSTMGLRAKVRDEITQARFSQAEKELTQPEILADGKNRLLTLLDLGLTAHYMGEFEKSNRYFFAAKRVHRELFTQSVSEGVSTVFVNDTASTYSGLDYEVSLAHYYSALNFFFLSRLEKIPAWKSPELRQDSQVLFAAEEMPERVITQGDQVKFLQQSRSELLAWNSFLQDVRQRNRGEPYYKDDLVNKALAAHVHRVVGSINDLNTAKILRQDLEKLLVRAYAAYPSFNDRHESYVKEYRKFEEIGESAVKSDFIAPTSQMTRTSKSIGEPPGNVTVVVEAGEVPERKEKSYVIGLSTLFSQIKDPALRRSVEEIGAHLLLEMAPKFGLAFVAASVVGASTASPGTTHLSQAVDSAIGFEFKLPIVESSPVAEQWDLRFRGEGVEATAPVALLNPMGDIARLNVSRRADSVALKTGVRVGMKYLAAFVPAVATYHRMKDSPDFIRWAAAMGVWMAGKKIVDASEKADIRSWNTIPNWIGVAEANLRPGKYQVELLTGGSAESLGEVSVMKSGFMRVRKFSSGKIVVQ